MFREMYLEHAFIYFHIWFYTGQLLKIKHFNVNIDTPHRIISSIHASCISWYALSYLLGYISEPSWINHSTVSIGYALYDILDIYLRRKTLLNQFIGHHSLMILGMLPYIFNTYRSMPHYSYYLAIHYLAEISTPFLNIAWYCHDKKREDSIVYKTSAYLTGLLYIPFRLITNTYLSYISFTRFPVFILPQLAITGLNYTWFYKIVNKLRKNNTPSTNLKTKLTRLDDVTKENMKKER